MHSAEYISYLQHLFESGLDKSNFWEDKRVLVPQYFTHKKPADNAEKAGYYATDTETPIYPTTYAKISQAAYQAYLAAEYRIKSNNTVIYALVGMAGHHAKWEHYGGYCFFNNTFICANRLVELGAKKVAILDLDYHAGNGTAELLLHHTHLQDKINAYSIHCNPEYEYPYFEGFESENTPFIQNIPFESGIDDDDYSSLVMAALQTIYESGADQLVIAFGGDTYGGDPEHDHFTQITLDCYSYLSRILAIMTAKSDFPKLTIVQEGGYNLDKIGTIVTNLLGKLA